MSHEPDDNDDLPLEENLPFERDFVRRDMDLEQSGLGGAAFHGTLLICALLSLYLRIIGIGG